MQIPVIHVTDVVVFGARSGAVAAALAVHETGRSVVAISDRSYFGEETAGTLQLWPEEGWGDALTHPALAATGGVVTPRSLKHSLELSLLRRDIPFLYGCRPVAPLYDERGAMAGFVFAARTSLYAVLGQLFIDASRTGLLARLAGLELTTRATPSRRSLMVIGSEPPPAELEWHEVRTGLEVQDGRWDGPLVAYRVDMPFDPSASPLDSDFIDRTRVHYPGLHISADTWLEGRPECLATDGTPADHWSALRDASFIYCDGRLIVMNELLPLTAAGAASIATMEDQLRCGEHIGHMAAKQLASLPPTARIVGGTTSPYRFAPAFLRPREAPLTIDASLPHLPSLTSCDVLIAGGGTAGASAGIAAARAGAKCLVVERLHGLGGLGTLGLISAYYLGNRIGFTSEVDQDVMRTRPKGKSNRWNPSHKLGWYLNTLQQAGGAAWFNTFAFGVQMDGSRLTGVLVSTPFGAGLVETHTAIDATGNADLAAAAGAPCREVGATHIAVQGTGLGPRKLGQIYSNTDWTFIDENDVVGVTHAFVAARAKFPEAFDTVPLIGTRERRQIIGEIELSPVDFLAGRTFPDTILTAKSNFDSHGYTIHPAFAVLPPDKSLLSADVPFRCMLPRQVEGLLVTGLGVSAHRDAMPVIRMQADVQNQGYAAGVAAAHAARDGCDVRDVDIRELQQHLVAKGILEPGALVYKDSFPLPEDVVLAALQQHPLDVAAAAIILSAPSVSTTVLLERLRAAESPEQAEEAAIILGLWGHEEAAPVLAHLVDFRDWDEGWNFTGMGQFGMTLSRMDVLLIALGKTRSKAGIEPILRKIRSLDESSAFSHCRAVSVAASAHRDPSLAEALYQLLQSPGMQGHAHLHTRQVVAEISSDPNETATRNASLKELILARGLYLCGDWEGLGKAILSTYAHDLRGHYARHARAVLEHPDPVRLGTEVM